MKRTLGYFFTSLICMIPLSLSASEEVKAKVELGQGFRQDHLKWSVEGPHHKPNILSELDYKDMHVYLTTLKASLTNGTYIGMLELAYGDILSGKERDSDYNRDNRHREFSRSVAKVSGDYTVDSAVRIGRLFPLSSGIIFTPSIGYGAFWQHLHVKDGKQIIPYHGSIHHLNSTFKTRWSAPFIDLRMAIPLRPSLTLDAGYRFFYPVQYTGKGFWNLRSLHFTQKNDVSKSFGQKADIAFRWACTDHLELGLGCGLASFIAKDGTVKSNERSFKSHTPLHRASRTCIDYLASLSYAF